MYGNNPLNPLIQLRMRVSKPTKRYTPEFPSGGIAKKPNKQVKKWVPRMCLVGVQVVKAEPGVQVKAEPGVQVKAEPGVVAEIPKANAEIPRVMVDPGVKGEFKEPKYEIDRFRIILWEGTPDEQYLVYWAGFSSKRALWMTKAALLRDMTQDALDELKQYSKEKFRNDKLRAEEKRKHQGPAGGMAR
jgi:hypothetical protein